MFMLSHPVENGWPLQLPFAAEAFMLGILKPVTMEAPITVLNARDASQKGERAHENL